MNGISSAQESTTTVAEDFGDDENLTDYSNRDRHFTQPGHVFRGQQLWPFTWGMSLLLRQVSSPEDTALTRWLKFIFLHIKRTEDTATADRKKHVVPLAWDLTSFHAALVDWVDQLGDLDDALAVEAHEVYEAMLKQASESEVDVIGDSGKKKKTQTPPPTPASSSG
jgi:hypothetical protein